MADRIQKDGRLRPIVLIVLSVLLVGIALICTTLGRYEITVGDVLGAFSAKLTGAPLDATIESVIFNLRLPRILLAIVLGAGLACAGAAFQSLFSNPLATPDTLGVTAGASVGAVIALMADFRMIEVQTTALLFGLASVVLTVISCCQKHS